MDAAAELAALKADNLRLKAEAEVAQLKVQMAQLAADNAALRGNGSRDRGGGGGGGAGGRRHDHLPTFGEPGYAPPPLSRGPGGPDPDRPQRKLIEFPVCDDAELDAAWEDMMTECLADEGKREALRQTYYEQKDQEGKYYFFLEWASYLRKPEVMEQNAKKEQSVSFNTEREGMRRRKGGGDDVGDGVGAPQFAGDDKYDKYTRRGLNASRLKSSSTSVGTVFSYFLLVMAISVSMYLVRYFMGFGSPFGASKTLEQETGDGGWDD